MPGIILCLTGKSAVGKSTISRALSEDCGLPFFSIGDYQKERYGIPRNFLDLEPEIVDGGLNDYQNVPRARIDGCR